MGLTAKNIVSLTWDQVDLEKNLIHLPEGEVPLTAAAKRILAKRLQKRTEDLHVLLSAESKKLAPGRMAEYCPPASSRSG